MLRWNSPLKSLKISESNVQNLARHSRTILRTTIFVYIYQHVAVHSYCLSVDMCIQHITNHFPLDSNEKIMKIGRNLLEISSRNSTFTVRQNSLYLTHNVGSNFQYRDCDIFSCSKDVAHSFIIRKVLETYVRYRSGTPKITFFDPISGQTHSFRWVGIWWKP